MPPKESTPALHRYPTRSGPSHGTTANPSGSHEPAVPAHGSQLRHVSDSSDSSGSSLLSIITPSSGPGSLSGAWQYFSSMGADDRTTQSHLRRSETIPLKFLRLLTLTSDVKEDTWQEQWNDILFSLGSGVPLQPPSDTDTAPSVHKSHTGDDTKPEISNVVIEIKGNTVSMPDLQHIEGTLLEDIDMHQWIVEKITSKRRKHNDVPSSSLSQGSGSKRRRTLPTSSTATVNDASLEKPMIDNPDALPAASASLHPQSVISGPTAHQTDLALSGLEVTAPEPGGAGVDLAPLESEPSEASTSTAAYSLELSSRSQPLDIVAPSSDRSSVNTIAELNRMGFLKPDLTVRLAARLKHAYKDRRNNKLRTVPEISVASLVGELKPLKGLEGLSERIDRERGIVRCCLAKTIIYLHIAYRLSGTFLGLAIVATQYSRCFALNADTVVIEVNDKYADNDACDDRAPISAAKWLGNSDVDFKDCLCHNVKASAPRLGNQISDQEYDELATLFNFMRLSVDILRAGTMNGYRLQDGHPAFIRRDDVATALGRHFRSQATISHGDKESWEALYAHGRPDHGKTGIASGKDAHGLPKGSDRDGEGGPGTGGSGPGTGGSGPGTGGSSEPGNGNNGSDGRGLGRKGNDPSNGSAKKRDTGADARSEGRGPADRAESAPSDEANHDDKSADDSDYDFGGSDEARDELADELRLAIDALEAFDVRVVPVTSVTMDTILGPVSATVVQSIEQNTNADMTAQSNTARTVADDAGSDHEVGDDGQDVIIQPYWARVRKAATPILSPPPLPQKHADRSKTGRYTEMGPQDANETGTS